MQTTPMILFIVATLVVLVGVILFIAGVVRQSEDKLQFEVADAYTGTVTCKDDACGAMGGFDVLILDSLSASECETAALNTKIQGPDGIVTCTNKCGTVTQFDDYSKNIPKLKEMCTFETRPGLGVEAGSAYTVSDSGQKIWIVDVGEELGKSFGGAMASNALLLVSFMLLFCGSICCFVGCCFLCCMGGK